MTLCGDYSQLLYTGFSPESSFIMQIMVNMEFKGKVHLFWDSFLGLSVGLILEQLYYGKNPNF